MAIALVDCNNFYVSCERVFQPEYNHKPVVVLSNNDGCIIARSNEAKALNIPMGAPLFKYKQLIAKYQVKLFSTNFALYGDMSRRVMQCLMQSVEQVEIYSIDEAFLHFKGMSHDDVYRQCKDLAEKIKQWTGIPVSIGLSNSKTLAKIAAKMAKKQIGQSVFDMRDEQLAKTILKQLELEDIWGLSYKGARHWRALGIYTPMDIVHSDPSYIRKKLGIVGERLVYELKGIPVLAKEKTDAKKSIMSTRSFANKTSSIVDLYRALSNYTFRACQKLRQQNGFAQTVHVFIRTSRYVHEDHHYKNSCTILLPVPSHDTSYILNHVKHALRNIYKPGMMYHKAGIILQDLIAGYAMQKNLFVSHTSANNSATMHVMDQVNQKAGKDVLFLAAQGVLKDRKKKDVYRSSSYTTQWKNLLHVS